MHLLRKLSFVIGLAALLVAQPGFALGLGESELKSALNQPFQADIQLTNLRGLSRNEIIVRLASQEDFERAGLERMAFYGQLEFELLLDHPEGPIVRVTTQQPVREPYMNFLVEARWASGRLLREYTFLLDLPTFDDERQAQPVQSATSGSTRSTAERQPATRPQPRQRAESDTRPQAGYDGDTYSVTSNDTLWEIALRVRPGRDLSVQQTMLAIQRKNPEAFINGNINLLREGQVLRLPNRDEIRNLNPQNAVREVAEHNREWSGGALGAQLDAGQRSTSQRSGPSDVSGQVRLAAPSQGNSGEAGQGGGASTDSGSELQAELSAAQEELEKSRRENRELSSRVEELEAQIDTMESLIEASNEQLRALQTSAQQNREAEQAQDEAADVAAAEPSPEAEAEAESPAAAADTSEAAAPAQEEPVDRSKRVVRSIPQEKTLMDHVMDNLLWIGAGVLVVLLGVFALLRRRQSGEAPVERDSDDDFEPAFDEEGFAEEFDSDEVGSDETGIDLAQEDAEPEEPDAWDEQTDDSVEAETGDVVGEADIYIAYGKLDQAEELLLKGLDKEPASPAILSKLLEVYAENRDVEAFDRHYSTLLGTDDRSAIQRAGELRDTIPGAGEFDVNALDTGASAPADEQDDFSSLEQSDSDDFDFNLDLDDEPKASQSDAKSTDDNELSLDDDFNFDLDDDLDLEDETVEPVTTESDLDASSNRYDLSFDESEPAAADEEFSLDFDLDDEDDQVTLQSEQTAEAGDGDQDDFPELDLKLDNEMGESDAPVTDSVSTDDDWNFELDETSSEGGIEALDDALSELDEEPAETSSLTLEPMDGADSDKGSEAVTEDDDLSLDFQDDADDELTVHESGLDRDATSEDEQEAGQDAFADLDDALAEDWSDAQRDQEPGVEAKPAADDSDDLDLDALETGDLDLSSLDEEMSDLDADLEGASDSEPESTPQTDTADQAPEPASTDVDEDQVFEEALSGLASDDSAATESDSQESDEDMDAELDFLADTDEAATKLDLARAYIDMGDADGARDILEEVRQEGNEQQQQEAEELLGRIES
ncbi:FimV/HubP family polar landmark protein [Marinimicrobium sp. LS-A18]|uniref:FimV/HubP family polar landmark protein n=1 Tax=Marinimicrobium sp. LS-A18 TaxID=1381596 RepID=UPI000463D994|nr:FimV/HubP family polar landmark protein [Marinimicrobium sp. LS-A18]